MLYTVYCILHTESLFATGSGNKNESTFFNLKKSMIHTVCALRYSRILRLTSEIILDSEKLLFFNSSAAF